MLPVQFILYEKRKLCEKRKKLFLVRAAYFTTPLLLCGKSGTPTHTLGQGGLYRGKRGQRSDSYEHSRIDNLGFLFRDRQNRNKNRHPPTSLAFAIGRNLNFSLCVKNINHLSVWCCKLVSALALPAVWPGYPLAAMETLPCTSSVPSTVRTHQGRIPDFEVVTNLQVLRSGTTMCQDRAGMTYVFYLNSI